MDGIQTVVVWSHKQLLFNMFPLSFIIWYESLGSPYWCNGP